MKGVNITTVSELLGNKSIVMTKRYSHPKLEHKRHAVETVDLDAMDTYLDTKVRSIKSKNNVIG